MFTISRSLSRGSLRVLSSIRSQPPHTRTFASASKHAKGRILDKEKKASARKVPTLKEQDSDDVTPEPEHPLSSRIFIGGIPKTATVQDLEEVLSGHDKLLDIRLSDGFAHVLFTDIAAATQALHTLNDKQILGKRLSVAYSSTLSTNTRLRLEETNAKLPQTSRLFITNLPPDVTAQELETIFSKYGRILDLQVHKPTGGKIVSQAHVEFEDVASSTTALDAEQGTLLRLYTVLIMYAKGRPTRQGRSESLPTKRLFVGRLPQYTMEQDLRAALEGVAGVQGIKLVQEKCFAHVGFEDVVCAAAAYDVLRKGGVKGQRVNVDYASPKIDQKQEPVPAKNAVGPDWTVHEATTALQAMQGKESFVAQGGWKAWKALEVEYVVNFDGG